MFNIKNNLSIKEVLALVSESSLLSNYFSITKIPCLIKSPIREDKKPSFYIFKAGTKIRYKDMATQDSGDILDLLQKTWNMDLQAVLTKIQKDFRSHIKQGFHKSLDKTKEVTINSNYILQCKIRSWEERDLLYWQSQGITKDWLKFGNIYPISHIIYSKGTQQMTLRADKYAYAYVETKDKIVSLKIYQPFSTTHKWRNKHNSSVWALWNKLPKRGDSLIITSSRKDALCLWSNIDIPACSMQAESCIPKKQVITELKTRFKHIYVLYDNDFKNKQNDGHILGKHLSEMFDLIQIEIPTKYGVKDSSDLYHKYGKEKFIEIINNIINKKK